MSTLNRESIFETCDDILFRTGRLPTYEAIRKQLGGGGSNATIARYKSDWEATLRERIAHAAQRPEIPEHVWNAGIAFWDAARSAAGALFEKTNAQIQGDASKAVDSAKERAALAEQKAQAHASRCDALERRLAESERTAAEAVKALAACREKLAATSATVEQLSVANTQLRAELSDTRQRAESAASNLRDSHQADVARWQREIDAVRLEAKAAAKNVEAREKLLRGEAAEARRHALETAHSLQGLKKRCDEMQQQLVRLGAERDEALHSVRVALESRVRAETERDLLRERIKERADKRQEKPFKTGSKK